MGTCGRVAFIEIYLKISNERCECGGEWGSGELLRVGGGVGRCWEKDVDFRERWLVRCGGVLLCGGAIVRGQDSYFILFDCEAANDAMESEIT